MAPAAVATSTATAAPTPKHASGTAPLPAALVAASSPDASSSTLTREPARDTLAPSSFGVLSGNKPAAPAPMRTARAPLPTLGELEGVSATATLRPPGAVPPPPRALPMQLPSLDAGFERGGALEAHPTDAPEEEPPFTLLAGDLPPSPRVPRPAAGGEPAHATVVSAGSPPTPGNDEATEPSLDSTLDMSGSVSKKATQAALIEQTRTSAELPPDAELAPGNAVPAPGLFIADEPVEPRFKQPSLVSAQRDLLTRMRVIVFGLAVLLLMLAGALMVMIFRRTETSAPLNAMPTASSVPLAPGCRLALPPSRISPTIERAVPISALALNDGSIALGIAATKATAAAWIYDPVTGEPARKLDVPGGSGDISHVSAADPLLVDRASADFAFAQTLAPGLTLGVGPSGILRRGDDGATGVVWPLPTGVRVTPPRTASLATGHFVAFRQGGAEGQIMTGWLRPDGTAASDLASVQGAPKSLGTPNVALTSKQGLALFAARDRRSDPYRVHATRALLGQKPSATQALELPAEGGGAIAPSLVPLSEDRYLVQWTDGNVGRYQVHVRLLDGDLKPLGQQLLVSAKGANAGQGTLVVTGSAAVSFFIQTTAGHDELWGATLSCH